MKGAGQPGQLLKPSSPQRRPSHVPAPALGLSIKHWARPGCPGVFWVVSSLAGRACTQIVANSGLCGRRKPRGHGTREGHLAQPGGAHTLSEVVTS